VGLAGCCVCVLLISPFFLSVGIMAFLILSVNLISSPTSVLFFFVFQLAVLYSSSFSLSRRPCNFTGVSYLVKFKTVPSSLLVYVN